MLTLTLTVQGEEDCWVTQTHTCWSTIIPTRSAETVFSQLKDPVLSSQTRLERPEVSLKVSSGFILTDVAVSL